MAVLKRNLWTLFWLILVGGVILLAVILNHRWHSIFASHETYHKNRVELIAQTFDSILRTQELVLDVIGRELLNDGKILDTRQQVPLLDNILAVDNALIGFGLARTDGTLIGVSSNLDMSKLPNLRTNPNTAASFAQALIAETMVLGRTYHVDAMDAWAIPIRKALRNAEGDIVAVMTAGLRIGSNGFTLAEKLHDGPYDSVTLFRETDGYMQFTSADNSEPETYSAIQVPLEVRLENHRKFETQLGMPIAAIKQQKQAVSVRSGRSEYRTLTAAVFNPRYQLWVISDTRLTPIWNEFFDSLIQYVIVFFAISGVLLALFQVLDRAARKRNAELLYHSTHDDLTGVLNRAGLLNRLNKQIEAGHPFSLIVVNIDNFKGINDRYGQETGDCTLIEFGRRLQTLLQADDTLARLGGDEFVIMSHTHLNHLKPACHDLVEALSHSINVGRLQLQASCSIGVATYPKHGDSCSKLLRSAHLALYKAKQNRNSVSIYHREMEMAYLRRLAVEERLRIALSRDTLYMMYQPQMDDHGRIAGMEALARWQDEELGPVSPAEFVEVAEQSGLMNALGHFVLETSVREYSRLRAELGIRMDLGINISVIQFEQPDFVESVLTVLETWHVPAEELVLEITETLVMHNFDQVLQTVQRLQREGIRLSMDDFGTGYSSLSLLRKLPINELKIDKSFVDSMLEDERAANMIQSIVYIARSHNMHVVVEGVELEAQTSKLIEMGCRRFQGYYFSRPARMECIREFCLEQAERSLIS